MMTRDLTRAEMERSQMLAGRLRGVRKESLHLFLGLPLYSIAVGPDLVKGEWRGHTRGVAVGILALGGTALGYYAAGGVAYGSYVSTP